MGGGTAASWGGTEQRGEAVPDMGTPRSILLRSTEQSAGTSSAALGWRGCWKAQHLF